TARPRRTTPEPARHWGVLALVIGGLGMAELLAEPGPVHQAGTTSSRLVQETATCTLALAVGLFVAAARPRYAAAMLPVMVCFTGVLTVLAALDLAAGLVTVSDVLAHLPVLVASGLLYAVYRSRRCAAPAAAFDGLPGQLPEPAPWRLQARRQPCSRWCSGRAPARSAPARRTRPTAP